MNDEIEENVRHAQLMERAEADVYYLWRWWLGWSLILWFISLGAVIGCVLLKGYIPALVIAVWTIFDVVMTVKACIRAKRRLGYWPWKGCK